jgi:hypothetical protein
MNLIEDFKNWLLFVLSMINGVKTINDFFLANFTYPELVIKTRKISSGIGIVIH